jgi:micrococcal nuclease
MNRYLLILLLLPLLLSDVLCNEETSGQNQKESETYFSVTKVSDGDTFWIDDGSAKGQKIRLIGVDAPESRKTGRKEKGYYGKEAKEYAKRLLTGKRVRLEFDIGRYDRYRRTLAYVYLKDGTFVNAELIKQGYAMVMTVPPNVKYAGLFLKLQQEARKNHRGLWKRF